MASITPFGQTGPKAKDKACDLTCWASGGALYCAGDPDPPPVQLSFPQAYLHAEARAAAGSLIALYHREQTGEAQQIDVSIQESVMAVLMATPEMWDLNKFVFRRRGYASVHPGRGVRQRFGIPCKDGYATLFMLGGLPRAGPEHTQLALVKAYGPYYRVAQTRSTKRWPYPAIFHACADYGPFEAGCQTSCPAMLPRC